MVHYEGGGGGVSKDLMICDKSGFSDSSSRSSSTSSAASVTASPFSGGLVVMGVAFEAEGGGARMEEEAGPTQGLLFSSSSLASLSRAKARHFRLKNGMKFSCLDPRKEGKNK